MASFSLLLLLNSNASFAKLGLSLFLFNILLPLLGTKLSGWNWCCAFPVQWWKKLAQIAFKIFWYLALPGGANGTFDVTGLRNLKCLFLDCALSQTKKSPKFISHQKSKPRQILLFLKWSIPGLFFFIFVFSGLQLTDNYVWRFYCQCWDSNHGSLVSEATARPTVPQPRPIFNFYFLTQFPGGCTQPTDYKPLNPSHFKRLTGCSF